VNSPSLSDSALRTLKVNGTGNLGIDLNDKENM
jgi:hypothetical protein